MSKLLRIVFIGAAVTSILVMAFILGPRDTVGPSPTLPDFQGLPLPELEARIQAQEKAVAGLRADAHQTIVWFDSTKKERTPISLVFLHGYTATRRELDPAPQKLARAIGANLFLMRLAGHGFIGPDGHRGVKADHWTADTARAVAIGKALGERVVLIGSSTGGTLAVWALAQPGWDVAAAILVSPNFGPREPLSELLSWPWSPALLKLLVGDYRTMDDAKPGHFQAWDVTHHSDSLLAMGTIVSYVRSMDFSILKSPILVFLHREDAIVNPDLTQAVFNRWEIPGKKLVLSNLQPPNSNHVLAGDLLSPDGTPIFVEESLVFLRETGIWE